MREEGTDLWKMEVIKRQEWQMEESLGAEVVVTSHR